MRKLTILAAAAATLGIANIAMAGATVQLGSDPTPQQIAARKAMYDHPATKVVPTKDLNVIVKTDSIMRSCCMPPNLVVAGDVTNTASHPVDYVKMVISFEDANGKVVHAETIYNSKAATLGEDEEVRRVLNEKPHFEPLPPGSTDKFSFSIPTPMLPKFAKVQLYPNAVTP